MNFIMIEDHPLMSEGTSRIIQEKSDFTCLGTFANISGTKNFLAEYCKNFDYQPLICLVDLNLGDENGFDLIRFISENYRNIFCICYSMFKKAGIVQQAVAAGAVGYVSKGADLKVLLQAMQKADKGSFFMEESLTSDYVIYTNLINSLTKREKQLTELFLQNKSEEEICKIMDITSRAIDNYMSRILSKLGVTTKKELLKKFGKSVE